MLFNAAVLKACFRRSGNLMPTVRLRSLLPRAAPTGRLTGKKSHNHIRWSQFKDDYILELAI